MKQYLTKAQRESFEEDRRRFQDQLTNPVIQEKGAVRRELQKVETILNTQSPPELKGQDLDKAVKEEKELREEIVPNMLSQEEMRKNPPGAVGIERAFQKRYKEKILRWKNLRRAIHRDSDDPDISNLERYRPTVSRLNMDNAQIPGRNFNFPSPQFQENYEKIDWGEKPEQVDETPAPQAGETDSTTAELEAENARLRAENESLREWRETPAPKPKKGGMSDENRRRQSERMKARHAARKAAIAAKEGA